MSRTALNIIFDSERDCNPSKPAEIDVVAVHGLNFKGNSDHARQTWTKDGKIWLGELLPSSLPKPVRVMLYEYNSSPAVDAAAIKLDDHARNLLLWLTLKRKNLDHRPLIFICHSLGGLVVKEALVEANLDISYKSIVENTRLLTFFATPHQGGKYAGFGEIIAKLVKRSMRKPGNDLLNALKKQSDDATRRFEQSRHLFDRCHVVSFFEGVSYRKLGIIVDKKSATLNLPGTIEKQVPLDADHSSICKLDLADNGMCELVLGTINMQLERALETQSTSEPERCLEVMRTSKIDRTSDVEPRNVHWLVPQSVNPLFTGRSRIIRKIKHALAPDTADRESLQQRRFVLTGLGGQGKSEVCLKIAEELRDLFWGIFWVDVSSRSAASSNFSRIAQQLGSSARTIDAVRDILSNCERKQNWLLVLDNADNPSTDYKQFLPSGNRGSVMMTSRLSECKKYSPKDFEELESLDREECINLLLKAAEQTEESRPIADAIVTELGSHTLAVLQAGTYISHGHSPIAGYLDVYRKNRQRLLTFNPSQIQSRYCNLYATFEASIEPLEASRTEESQDSLLLLGLLSAVHYEHVAVELFHRVWRGANLAAQSSENEDAVEYYWHLSQWHTSQVPSFLRPEDNAWDSYRFSKALYQLQSLSLVKKNMYWNSGFLSMHPLTHSWLKSRQNHSQIVRIAQAMGCVIALSHYTPDSREIARSEWNRGPMGHHVSVLLDHNIGFLKETTLSRNILQLVVRLGWLMYDTFQGSELRDLFDWIFQMLGATWTGPSHEYLPLYALASRVAIDLGQLRLSIDMSERMIQILTTQKNSPGGDVWRYQLYLGTAYIGYSQHKEAIQILKEVRESQRSFLAEDHPMQLFTEVQLATAYREDNQTEEAIELYEKVLRIGTRILPESHLELLEYKKRLASGYLNGDKWTKAIQLLKEVSNIERTRLTRDHPSSLWTQHQLAVAYLGFNQAQKSIKLFKKILKVGASQTYEDPTRRTTTMHELARAYLAINKSEYAIKLFKAVGQMKAPLCDKDHPDRRTLRGWLATAYLHNDQPMKAIKLLRKNVDASAYRLDEDHPDRLSEQHWLALAYLRNRQPEEAIKLLEHVCKIEAVRLDKHDPNRKETTEDLRRAKRMLAQGVRSSTETDARHESDSDGEGEGYDCDSPYINDESSETDESTDNDESSHIDQSNNGQREGGHVVHSEQYGNSHYRYFFSGQM